MKKFLVLLLVLGLATVSQANLVFTVNDLDITEITLAPSDTISIDMLLTAGSISEYTLKWEVLSPAGGATQLGEFVGTNTTFPMVFMLGSGFTGAWGKQLTNMSGSNFGMPITTPGTIMDNFLLHCNGPGDIIIKVTCMGGTSIDGQAVSAGTVMRTILIHQIPEPATMMLLGLGSLFLLRRKK